METWHKAVETVEKKAAETMAQGREYYGIRQMRLMA